MEITINKQNYRKHYTDNDFLNKTIETIKKCNKIVKDITGYNNERVLYVVFQDTPKTYAQCENECKKGYTNYGSGEKVNITKDTIFYGTLYIDKISSMFSQKEYEQIIIHELLHLLPGAYNRFAHNKQWYAYCGMIHSKTDYEIREIPYMNREQRKYIKQKFGKSS